MTDPHPTQEEGSSMTDLMETQQDLKVGDRIRFVPQHGNRWWTIRARNERFIVATGPVPFEPTGTLCYTAVDLTGWTASYNGVGPGVARSSLNILGGGWDIGPNGEGCDEVLAGLASGEWELSRRRVMQVDDIEVSKLGASR